MADPVAQYLERHARPEVEIAAALEGDWEAVVVLPVMAESVELFAGLESLGERQTLVICVVNHSAGATPRTARANRQFLDAARTLGRARPGRDDHIAAPHFDLLLVDRASPGRELPAGQGVGLARRIGMDIALALAASGRVAGGWLHTTDADVTLPPGYLDAATGAGDPVALTYPYWHRLAGLGDLAARALALYEISLRYYVLGVGHARVRPAALSAIGSTLAVRPRAYASVRGVPLREAGEDFYLLAKLAKIGSVARPRCAPIEIAGRTEIRAPFGTAPAIARIATALEAGAGHAMYNPKSFAMLGRLRRALDRVAGGGPLKLGEPTLEAAFAAVGGPAVIDRIAAIETPAIRERELAQWLDALKVLRLIHELRDAGLADRPWRRALGEAPFVDIDPAGDLEAIRRDLAAAEDRILVDECPD